MDLDERLKSSGRFTRNERNDTLIMLLSLNAYTLQGSTARPPALLINDRRGG